MTAPSPEAIRSAGEAYGAMLADPETADRLRRHRAQRAAQTSARLATPRPAERIKTPTK